MASRLYKNCSCRFVVPLHIPGCLLLLVLAFAASAEDGNSQLKTVLFMCLAVIYITLFIQFNNAVKPLLVFAAVPYGVCGAFAALYIMNSSSTARPDLWHFLASSRWLASLSVMS